MNNSICSLSLKLPVSCELEDMNGSPGVIFHVSSCQQVISVTVLDVYLITVTVDPPGVRQRQQLTFK
jgi:hypothetical protein